VHVAERILGTASVSPLDLSEQQDSRRLEVVCVARELVEVPFAAFPLP
jgi:hypothetical protein